MSSATHLLILSSGSSTFRVVGFKELVESGTAGSQGFDLGIDGVELLADHASQDVWALVTPHVSTIVEP